MRRFILIDPCLTDPGSHPFQYAIDVLTAAERAGFACEAVVNRGVLDHVAEWPRRFRLAPLLEASGHSKYTAFGELDRLGPHGAPRLRLAVPWAGRHAARRREERIVRFAATIEPVVRGIGADDVVLIATASELEVAGLARAIRATGGSAGAGWHALFHYPLYRGLGPDFPRQERRLDRLRRLLAAAVADAAPARIHVHVTTAELAAQYARLGVGPVGVLPYPVRPVGRETLPVANRPLRIAVLGDARPEKGSQHLAALVERVGDDPELRGRLAFAIQANTGCPATSRKAEDRAVLRSLARLATLARDPGDHARCAVELLPGPLMGAEYEAQLARADATILPYDQRRYRYRCSGVLLESLASGIVPIVTGGGSMARILAGPIRDHVAALLARSRMIATVQYEAIRTAVARPWETTIDPPAAATAVVVSLRWRDEGAAAILAVPATVEVVGETVSRAATMVAADADGRGKIVLPLVRRAGRPGPLRLRIAPADHPAPLDLAAAVLTTIDAGTPAPVGQAGIVAPPDADVAASLVAAVREFVRHADHYVRTAREQAAGFADGHSGRRVVETLLATTVPRE